MPGNYGHLQHQVKLAQTHVLDKLILLEMSFPFQYLLNASTGIFEVIISSQES